MGHSILGVPRGELPPQARETADVSPRPVTQHRKPLLLLGTDQDGIQEADGSIPFSSTTSMGGWESPSGGRRRQLSGQDALFLLHHRDDELDLTVV
jgi:hypothetical protein